MTTKRPLAAPTACLAGVIGIGGLLVAAPVYAQDTRAERIAQAAGRQPPPGA